MRKQILVMAAVSMMAAGGLMAAEKAVAVAAPDASGGKEKLLERIGATRGRIIAKLFELRKLTDSNQNGAQAAYSEAGTIVEAIRTTANKSIQEENVKPQEMRNQALVETATKKRDAAHAMWMQFANQEWQTYTKLMPAQAEALAGVNTLFVQYLINIEAIWNNSGIGLDILATVLDRIEKQMDEIKIRTTPIVADVIKAAAPVIALSKE